MSNGLAPSKSTVYVSNLPYSLTNNDLHKVFEKYGRVVKITVKKDKVTRRSQGVAFVLFLRKEDAQNCARSLNGQELFGRRLKSSIAVDNGRSTEFIRRRNYPDKRRCYECGEEGHMSYGCSKNALGEREPPPKKERKRKKKEVVYDKEREEYFESDEECQSSIVRPPPNPLRDEVQDTDEELEPDLETLSAAIQLTQQQIESESTEESKVAVAAPPRKKIRQSTYFSDEEDFSD